MFRLIVLCAVHAMVNNDNVRHNGVMLSRKWFLSSLIQNVFCSRVVRFIAARTSMSVDVVAHRASFFSTLGLAVQCCRCDLCLAFRPFCLLSSSNQSCLFRYRITAGGTGAQAPVRLRVGCRGDA